MAGFVINLITYLAACCFLSVIWALTSGSFEELRQIATGVLQDPGIMRQYGFWPIWVWLTWGLAVVIHFGVVIGVGVFGSRRRRRRRKAEHASVEGEHVPRDGRAGREPTRTWVTVMFTDVVDSTTLNERLGDEAWSRLLAAHRATVRQFVAERGGAEVGTQGDGFLVRFKTPVDAVLCAVDLQRALLENPSSPTPLQMRIGIHAGEVVEEDGDLVGRVVNVAARVAAEAKANEILVTEPVADHVGVSLGFEDRGVHELRGVSQRRHLLAVLWSDHDDPLDTTPSPRVVHDPDRDRRG